jgi:hypothetical protein
VAKLASTRVGAGGHRHLFAPCPALWHPPPTGSITRRRAHCRALRPAQLAPSPRLAGAEDAAAPPTHDRGRPRSGDGRKPAVYPAHSHGPQLGVGRGCHLPVAGRRALFGHLTQYLLAAGSRLPPRPADIHRAGAHRPGAGAEAASASSWPAYPRRLRQPLYQRDVPGATRKSLGLGQLQPAG